MKIKTHVHDNQQHNKQQHNSQQHDNQRIDSWLWVSRFYKTKKLIREAIAAGHIQLNGNKPKPGKNLRTGDQLLIRKNHQEFNIIVNRLSPRRQSAELTKGLYDEPQWSVEKRQHDEKRKRDNRQGVVYSHAKPDKRERKQARELKHQTADTDWQ